jgi:hypothetical protein
MERNFGRPYRDPVDELWSQTAHRLGMRVVRSADVFASWDGVEVLTISTPAHFDPDDSLAQMIFHEICHALIEGPAGRRQVDWGLDNIDDRHLVNEYACHRLQAALSGPWGLRTLMAPTTEHRPYYEALPPNPLSPGSDPAIAMAQAAWPAATSGPWSGPIREALSGTADIAAVLRRFAPDSLWAAALPPHPTGLPPGEADATCGGCAWFSSDRCARAAAPTAASQRACRYWHAPLPPDACAGCGACCRQGFDVVDLEPSSPIIAQHPEWVSDAGWGPQLPRPAGFCIALQRRASPFRCQVYADRPSGCRDLEIGGAGCLVARQRVGLAP